MIKVNQSIIANENKETYPVPGDCLRACVCSILEMGIDDVPHFIIEQDDWVGKMIQWLNSKGYEFKGCKYGTDVLTYDKGIDGYYIVNGLSRFFLNGKTRHSVVFKDGKMVHDPNPNSKGLQSIEYCYMIEKIDNK